MKLLLLLSAPFLVEGGCKVDKVTCYVDDPKRILDGTDENHGGSGLSQEYCAQLCSNKGKPFAGVEYGKQCYCGKAVRADAKTAPDGQCNMACPDSLHKGEKCGGNYRMGIFKYSCSGTPEPTPKPPPSPPRLVNPCLDTSGTHAKQPWCDASLPIEKRVEDMISRMSVEEKIGSLGSGAKAIDSLGIPAYNWWSEATHGISHVKNDANTPYETNFAFPITTGMSFNRTLWYQTGQRIAIEARAFMNAGNAWSTYWAPVINLAREPRWGRNVETPGEDSYLSGEYATSFVQGFEQNPADKEHIQASACCKHYAVNSMESSKEAGTSWNRHNFDANVTQQDLMDSYLPPFQACVEKGKVSGLMCSYNAINGVPSCANDWLLQKMARDTWKFDGYVTSDCDADNDVFVNHHYTKTPEETVRDVLRAGTDIDCGGFIGRNAQSALDKKVITEKDLDDRLKLAFRVRMRLSHFDPEGPLNKIPASEACSQESQAVARVGTTQSVSLIKNFQNTLPWNAAKLKSVAVIGPNALLSKGISGYYGGNSCNGTYWTMVDAVKQYVDGTVTASGVPTVLSTDTSKIADAVTMARGADAVVLVVGCDLSCGREGHDATSISLSSAQQQLIDSVAAAAKSPVTVVVLTHIPLDLTPVLANPKVGAVLHAGQPSVQTLGVGDVMFGKAVPAGRLIQTIYPAAYANQISIFDFNMRPGPSVWPRPDCAAPYKDCKLGTNPGRTHRFYTGKAVVPFGYGLSYTNFTYKVVEPPSSLSLNGLREHLESSPDHVPMNQPATTYTVDVTNTGAVDADDVVLGFLVPPGAGKAGVPLQSLFGFERVHVKAGQTARVTIKSELSEFQQVNIEGRRYALPGEYTVKFGVPAPGMGYVETKLKATLGASIVI